MIADRPPAGADRPRAFLPPGLRWRPLLMGAVAVLGILQLVSILRVSPWVWHDFTQDHVAIQEALAGRNPYETQNERIAQIFNMRPPKGPAYSFHPPTTLVFFLPLAPLPYRAAFVAWDLVLLLCLWGLVHLTARGIGRPQRPVVTAVLALALVLVWPIRENFIEGQLNIPVAAGLVAFWYCLRLERRALAGVALAAAAALKPLAGVFVLWALWRREWRVLGSATIAFVAIAAIGLGLAGVQGTIDYLTIAYPMHAALWPGFPDNASPQGFFSRLFGPNQWRRPIWVEPQLSTPLTLLTWATLLGYLFHRLGPGRLRASRLNLEFAAVGATMLLVTPIIWPHYYVALVAPLAILIADFAEQRDWRWLALMAVSIAVLWMPRNEVIPRGIGNVQLPALLAIYAAATSRLGPEPKAPPAPKPRWAEP